MRSIKTKLFSLAMAVSMVLALAGCAMSAPSTVGSIGGIEIPAGIYLLAQYNSYNTASGVAELATGETASDVKAVLKATCTGTINGEDVTARFESGKLVLPALRSDCVLRVVFAPADAPATGDAAGRLLPVCLSAAALCLCCLALLGKKHRTI